MEEFEYDDEPKGESKPLYLKGAHYILIFNGYFPI